MLLLLWLADGLRAPLFCCNSSIDDFFKIQGAKKQKREKLMGGFCGSFFSLFPHLNSVEENKDM
jgi:hypothetical protein